MAGVGMLSCSTNSASDDADNYCDPCRKDGLLVVAEGYCKDCPEYLCGQCLKSHRRHKVLENHVIHVLDKDSMPVIHKSDYRAANMCEEKCNIHQSKVTEYFCETCNTLGCHDCVTLEHGQCYKVKHISDIAKDLENTEELKGLYEKIKSSEEKLCEYQDLIVSNITNNTEMRKFAKLEIKRQRAVVNQYFDHLEKTIDGTVATIEQRNTETLKTASDRLSNMKRDLDQMKNDISTKQTCELFIAMKKANPKIATYDDQFDKCLADVRIQRYTVLPSMQIQAMKRTVTEICSLATVKLESETDMCASTDKRNPFIRSLAIVHGHFCAVVDNANKRVKVLDTKFMKVTSEIGIKARNIWSVVAVDDEHVAISISIQDNMGQIRFFSVSSLGILQKMEHERYYDTPYSDMVHFKGNIYALWENQIDVLDVSGNVIRSIQQDGDLFKDLKGISMNADTKTLYVTDCENNSVISMDLEGKVKTVYQDSDLKSPYGIVVDKEGYVYVRSTGNHRIHQLTADLCNVQVLISNVQGNRISFSMPENKLYIDTGQFICQYTLNTT